ncbi:MAG: RnfABCDGE type electron transport complex subunit G [bacterium]
MNPAPLIREVGQIKESKMEGINNLLSKSFKRGGVKDLICKILKFSLSLFTFCIGAAIILAGVDMITSRQIKANKIAEANIKRQKVLPQAGKDSFKEIKLEKENKSFFLGFDKNGGYAGSVFEVTGLGFCGPINITIGIDKENKVSGIAISKLDQSETPGLGIKITAPEFQDQFVGKTGEEIKLKKDGGGMDAITAATISSRAVVKAVKEGLAVYQEAVGGL